MDLKRRHHDLVGALRSINLAVDDIKRGYRFDDDLAHEKIRALERILGIFNEEIPRLSEKLLPPTSQR